MSQIAFFDLMAKRGAGMMGRVNPRWSSPEVLRGHSYSVQSDIYSYGLILWEVKRRKIAFADEFSDGTRFLSEDLRNKIIGGLRPIVDMSDQYDRLCAQCWSENPLHRPDANEIVDELASIVASHVPSLYAGISRLLQTEETEDVSESESASSPEKEKTSLLLHTLKCIDSVKVEESRVIDGVAKMEDSRIVIESDVTPCPPDDDTFPILVRYAPSDRLHNILRRLTFKFVLGVTHQDRKGARGRQLDA